MQIPLCDPMRPATRPWRPLRLLVWALALAACVLLALLPAAARAQAAAGRVAVPRQQGAVTDLTGTLGADQVAALRQKIAALHDSAGPTLAVLLVPSTGEDSIEQFAIRVFDDWKPGTAQDDNGLLLLVALNDRHMRIEVGQGLEGQVPDLAANQIIEEQMKPRFRQKDYVGGIDAAVDALAARLGTAAAPADADADAGVVGSLPAPPEPHGWNFTTTGLVLLSLLGLVGAAVAAVVFTFIGRNMRTLYRNNPRGFFVRLVFWLMVSVVVGISFDGDWAPIGLASFLALLFVFIPGTGRGGGGGYSTYSGSSGSSYSSSSDSSSSSSSSDSSSSSSSDSGGSSSGGGSSGDW
ncbi:MAG: TPM domain-containing protein [Pseudomonadota bacterium]